MVQRIKKDDECYCSSCGKIIKREAEICPKCGVRQKQLIISTKPQIVIRKWSTSLLISIFLGWFGLDRFYFNQNILGILKLLTFGGWGIWWFIDIILIASRNVGSDVKLVDKLENN